MLNVADIGAGSGYFTLPMARRVAPGKVYAVDLSAELLEVIRGKLAAGGCSEKCGAGEGRGFGDRLGGGIVRLDISLRRMA